MTKRYIRLKERPLSASGSHRPDDAYMRATDGSLAQIDYPWSTDDEGFLNSGSPAAGGRRVFVLGDSFVESLFALPEQRFTAQVEASLRRDGMSLDVLNAGYSGATSLQTLNALLNKVLPLARRQDVVVLFFSHSDAVAVLDGGGYWGSSDRYATLLPASARGSMEVRERGIEDFAAVVETTCAVARSFGLNLVLGVTPFRDGDFSSDAMLRTMYRRDRERYVRALAFKDSAQNVVRAAGQTNGLAVIDLDRALARDASLFYDELHLNALGHDRAAVAVAERLHQVLRDIPA